MEFLNFGCKGEQKKNPGRECNHRLGGPSLSTLNAHDFSQGPFVDIRLCQKCGWVQLTIDEIGKPVRMKVLGKGAKIDFCKPQRLFGFVLVEKESSKA